MIKTHNFANENSSMKYIIIKYTKYQEISVLDYFKNFELS
jgi:hypothetical protein